MELEIIKWNKYSMFVGGWDGWDGGCVCEKLGCEDVLYRVSFTNWEDYQLWGFSGIRGYSSGGVWASGTPRGVGSG